MRRVTTVGAMLLFLGVVVFVCNSPQTVEQLRRASRFGWIADTTESEPANCTKTCVIPSAKANSTQYENARAWLCDVGMRNMGKSCSDFTDSDNAPFNAYYQAHKAAQGDEACCFGNSDGIHDCLAEIQTECCAPACVVPSAKATSNQYENARAWLCDVGMRNMGKSCSDFTDSDDAPFNAYYQAYKTSQGKKACCFGNSDGIHDCLAHVETKCSIQSTVDTEASRITAECCKLMEDNNILPYSTWGSLHDQATQDWWNNHDCNNAKCFTSPTEEKDCCTLKKTYHIQPYSTWGSLTDDETKDWWNSHDCNNAGC